MDQEDRDPGGGGNVVSLAARRSGRHGPTACTPGGAPCVTLPRDTVYFITGGRFEFMVDGATVPVAAGDFVRVRDTAICHFKGTEGGSSVIACRLPRGMAVGLLHQLGAALPAKGTAFPCCGSVEFDRLDEIARRWGTRLDAGVVA